MRNRSGIQGVASNPVIVGAVTVLVVIVAVFLAYNANNGLPFVSTYNLKVKVPNADALVKGNEVRIGGVRVGIVEKAVPRAIGNGEIGAERTVSLDKSGEPLPGEPWAGGGFRRLFRSRSNRASARTRTSPPE